ncbi:solute carrier family 12 member 8-like isoform X2 [Paramacrobiotus metropolitanus]|uniref:solute carrier family 12 member 8-like isoform X2 n=1 Tax=Paramacrobiotus metropolitanus TaxID=2943436 RepID=UPI0024457273|nr:solute carrier family 12 member 8-like isoform X2 [Paramacrobiotus metropolitanus]
MAAENLIGSASQMSRPSEAPVGDAQPAPTSSPARPQGLSGLKSHNTPTADPRWFSFWKSNFCLRDNPSFGTWDGVFPASLAHLLNVIVFLRTGWIVAKAGVYLSISISVICLLIGAVTVLSASGILRRSSVPCRSIYEILLVTLGTRPASCIGIIYAFTHALSCSMHAMGLGELIIGLHYDANDHEWAVRAVACCCLLFLALLNALGIKWIIRAQILVVIIMALGVTDFIIGSTFRKDPSRGIEGPSDSLLKENLHPMFDSWHDYFQSLGIFFPSVVGVLVGFNIAADLRDPHRDIPKGTFAALFCSFWVHLAFILLLGMCVLRSFLIEHPHTTVRMSAVQVFIICAICVSSFSAGMGALYNASRVLSAVGKDTNIRILRNLEWEWQRYGTPVLSIFVMLLVALIFVLIGRINFLAPIITTSHCLTFASINYAYFALSTTYKMQVDREQQATTQWLQQGLREGRIASPESRSPKAIASPEGGGGGGAYGTMSHSSSMTSERSHLLGGGSLVTTPKDLLLPMKVASPVLSKPVEWYSKLHNRWVALALVVILVVGAFIIQWESALSAVSGLGLLYIAMYWLHPRTTSGIVEFHPVDWLRQRIHGTQQHSELTEESHAVPTVGETSVAAKSPQQADRETAPFLSR